MSSHTKPIKHYYTDRLHRIIYSTDASVYRKLPEAVAYPEDEKDIIRLVRYARENNLALTPRATGTSLSGQCVSGEIVVDISRYMNRILHFDTNSKTVCVQPGVIRDTLNDYLKPYGLFFSPNTSTTNRCTIGGMTGNNSAGSTSIKYGVTRDKVIRIRAVLSDGSTCEFKEIDRSTWHEKLSLKSIEGDIYRSLNDILTKEENRQKIRDNFPSPHIHRRNMGYALDALLDFKEFGGTSDYINPAKLLTGSEGSLAFFTEICIRLDELPPSYRLVTAVHFHSLDEALRAVPVSMQHDLYMCELMDDIILQQTKANKKQAKNRFFIQGDPTAVLLLENADHDKEKCRHKTKALIQDLQEKGLGYHYPVLENEDIDKAIELRAAGLGLLGNIPGDKRSVTCIEDTAVDVNELPDYILDFKVKMQPFGQNFVYYAHAGAGELHLRPLLNLKDENDRRDFHDITLTVAKLVKQYKGSISGEHGDGRVRSPFLPLMLGEDVYRMMTDVKNAFDPGNLFNPGIIIHPEPMTEHLRFHPGYSEPVISTKLDFSDKRGIQHFAEQCNGSGDCRKLSTSGGTMCPSFRASRDEKNTTRARANTLREIISTSKDNNPFDSRELYEVFDLCLSCKACSSECPSNVDVAALKAEFLYQYQKVNGVPFRSKLIAYNAKLNRFGSLFPELTNHIINNALFKKALGIALERKIPSLSKKRFSRWLKKQPLVLPDKKGSLYLFIDEFTEYYDFHIGKSTYELLYGLGYEIALLDHEESGRAFISKGMLDHAEKIAKKNIETFSPVVRKDIPLVGIEPSAILVFKDEYIRLSGRSEKAIKLASNTYTLEGFLAREYERGNIGEKDFNDDPKNIFVHAHCHQKAMQGKEEIKTALSIPSGYEVTLLETGCCGMAGAFGYEKEHYEFSMKVGETEVFPKIRPLQESATVAVSGTSCRHQIEEGTQRSGQHTSEILLHALKRKHK